ncbi:MAG: 4-hydroxythreonine-4-phosphate dehydrogenase PdxA [Hyphomonadaceae bacterium]
MRPLAVSMGDPAGIGLEVLAQVCRAAPCFLVGDMSAFARAGERVGVSLPLRRIARAEEAQAEADGPLCVLHEPLAMPETPGAPDPVNAAAVERAIRTGVAACLSGGASGLVTLPIAKASLYQAGFTFPGHTEFIGDLTKDAPWSGARGPVMMLACAELRVALASIHLPLAAAPKALSTSRIAHVGRVLAEALRRDFGIAKPRIALAALNPHAGEEGALGREEIEIINPAAAMLRAEGHDVRDAAPADTLFHTEARAHYDAVIAMYHDQGLIPLKTLDFWGGVNISLGLPIVRTSPDHGTGFALAGKKLARTDSVAAALRMAWAMAERRARA